MKPERACLRGAFDIVCPEVVGEGKPLVRVTMRSPKQHRKAVYLFAAYFMRQFGYDFVPYGLNGNDTDPHHVAFLWVAREYADSFCDSAWLVPCIGACCFRPSEIGMAMQFMWLHPFFRRRGLLTQAWPQFEQEFGRFHVEGPLSDAMEAALKKLRSEPGNRR
jgi:hypothetical protein